MSKESEEATFKALQKARDAFIAYLEDECDYDTGFWKIDFAAHMLDVVSFKPLTTIKLEEK